MQSISLRMDKSSFISDPTSEKELNRPKLQPGPEHTNALTEKELDVWCLRRATQK
jgi:hypothetical protein